MSEGLFRPWVHPSPPNLAVHTCTSLGGRKGIKRGRKGGYIEGGRKCVWQEGRKQAGGAKFSRIFGTSITTKYSYTFLYFYWGRRYIIERLEGRYIV